MRILSGIQFTTHLIEIFVVETKPFVCSFVHVILTRQTCGQRSSKTAESKRRELGNHFVEQIYYMFLIPKCRGYWDLGLCTTSVLVFGKPQRNGKIRFFLRRNTFFSRSRNCAAVLQMKVPKLCTDLDLKLLYILILGTCSKFARKNNFQALGVCFLQPCSSTGRRFAVTPRSVSLRRVSIQKPASRISQLSRRENGSIFPNTNF